MTLQSPLSHNSCGHTICRGTMNINWSVVRLQVVKTWTKHLSNNQVPIQNGLETPAVSTGQNCNCRGRKLNLVTRWARPKYWICGAPFNQVQHTDITRSSFWTGADHYHKSLAPFKANINLCANKGSAAHTSRCASWQIMMFHNSWKPCVTSFHRIRKVSLKIVRKRLVRNGFMKVRKILKYSIRLVLKDFISDAK